ELNHYSDPAIPFAAEYGADGQRLVDHGSPYGAVYLLPLAHRSPDALESTVSHLGSYLFHELTTPPALRLHTLPEADPRANNSGYVPGGLSLPARSFGTYAVWFPRGLLLRLAARHACRRLIDGWLSSGDSCLTPESAAQVNQYLQTACNDPSLQPEALSGR